MTVALRTLPAVRFHLSLNISDLDRSVAFYRVLFGMEPAKHRPDYAKFEPDDPPLVLSLEPNGRTGPGTLNHLGIRLPDARSLVAVQERLERAGIGSRREEGVECCYAKQTKFWVTDPDGTLWELYVLEEDIDHRGAGQSRESMLGPGGAVWEHRLGEAVPAPADRPAGSQDEVRLRGSFNVPLTDADRTALMAEAVRVLKPGGRLLVRILSGDKEHPSPALTGSGAAVRFVPAKNDVMALIARSGLTGIRLLKYDDPPCYVADGVVMRETHIEAFRV